MLIMDETLEPEEAIKKIREVRGPGAIQSVKVELLVSLSFYYRSRFRQKI